MALKVFLAYLLIFSVITFTLYATDKRRAQRNAWRIPEWTLLSCSFFGGAIGGYIAMRLLRHKTRKWRFHIVNIVGAFWQISVIIVLVLKPV